MSQYADFSFKTFDSYFLRFQINTVCNLFVNSICIYLILTKSTSAMGYYKYYILFTVISAMIMDLHISFVYGLYIFFPQPVACATGLARYANYYFGSIFNYVGFSQSDLYRINRFSNLYILC